MVKFNQQLKKDINKFLDYVIIVEGKKDVQALKLAGFEKVYTIHETGTPLKERILQIINLIDKKDKVCILTDFDKRGKKLYLLLKTELQMLGVRLDSTLRGILLKSDISHIEGVTSFFKKVENID
jgi:5S rRNA maturation endonuclease (ribonuclease M5)